MFDAAGLIKSFGPDFYTMICAVHYTQGANLTKEDNQIQLKYYLYIHQMSNKVYAEETNLSN